jgi:hypothetical protein
MRNYVAKHMNTYNRASVVQDKRSKHLDDVYEEEMNQALEDADERGVRSSERGVHTADA